MSSAEIDTQHAKREMTNIHIELLKLEVFAHLHHINILGELRTPLVLMNI